MATRDENKKRLERATITLMRLAYPNLSELALLPRNGPQVIAFNDLEAWFGLCANDLAVKLDAVDATVDPDTGDAIEIDTAGLTAANPLLTWQDFVRL